ncbi:DUF456 domain-containing protein [Rubrobacter indicoceani]|uniref:DUF456 domain-containing protein n=1 Tax=Rubrobacter indicoceani TaxID=2051957 RepID=UPI000E5C2909|nr:DUF456 domain-containing protein [Rubrobacter indicoceani]
MELQELYTQPVLWAALAGMLVGVVGSVVPGLPGVPLVFLSALIYAYFTGFNVVGGWTVAVIGVFAAIALIADFIFTSYGARRFGASNWGTAGGAVGGLVGTVVGFLFLGVGALVGLLAGTIGGVFLGEYLRKERARRKAPATDENPEVVAPAGETGDFRRTSRAAGGVLVGYVVSSVVQLALAVAGVGLFVFALFS